MKPDCQLSNCKSKPYGDGSCVASPPNSWNTETTTDSSQIVPDIKETMTQSSRFKKIFSNCNLTGFQRTAVILLSFTAICSWLAVCLILSNHNWERRILSRIESKLSEYQSVHPAHPYPGPGSLSTADANLEASTSTANATFESSSPPPGDPNLDLTNPEPTSTEASSSVTDGMTVTCTTPLFQDLESENTSNPDRTTAGYEQKPHDLLNSVGQGKKRKFFCRKFCQLPKQYHQSKFVYAYKTSITVEFESFGSAKKDAKASVTYEALKCLYPKQTFKSNIVPNEDWYTPENKPACDRPSTESYQEC